MERRAGKFVGQSYLSGGIYGFRFVSARDKHITRKVMSDLRKVFTPKYKNYE
jgi:hypothetical protein